MVWIRAFLYSIEQKVANRNDVVVFRRRNSACAQSRRIIRKVTREMLRLTRQREVLRSKHLLTAAEPRRKTKISQVCAKTAYFDRELRPTPNPMARANTTRNMPTAMRNAVRRLCPKYRLYGGKTVSTFSESAAKGATRVNRDETPRPGFLPSGRSHSSVWTAAVACAGLVVVAAVSLAG